MYKILTGIALVGTLVATSATANAQMGYGRTYAIPQGSYQQSCANVRVRGNILSATCTGPQGQRIYSTLDLSQCSGSGVANQNGYLACGNGYSYNYYGRRGHRYGNRNGNYNNGNGGYYPPGYGTPGYRYLPGGSYQSSCINATVQGATLTAACTNPNGQRITSSINVNMCASRGTDIRNDNGYLRC